jgi:Ca2+-binding RTX toxin-like protein
MTQQSNKSAAGTTLLDQQLEEAFANAQPGKPLIFEDLPGAVRLGSAEITGQVFPQEIVQAINAGGDFIGGDGGRNTLIGDGGSQLFVIKDQGGVDDITTGGGRDFIHIGDDSFGVDLIRDFDPSQDTIGISQEMNINQIELGQFGNSTLISDDKGNIAAILQNVSPAEINADNLRRQGNVVDRGVKRGIGGEEVAELFGSGGDFDAANFNGKVKTAPFGSGDAVLQGTGGNDKLQGREGDDLITAS